MTFVAKRVSFGPAASEARSPQSLLHTESHPQRFRKWLPTFLAITMTLLSLFVTWSVVSRLPTVFADTKALVGQVRGLEQQLHASTKTPEQQEANEEAIGDLHDRENKVQQERSRLNGKVADLQADLEASQKAERGLREQQEAAMQKLRERQKQLSAILGREVVIEPGPPLHFDAGQEPKPQWYYGGTVGYMVSRNYREKWNAWREAKAACDSFNAFQQATGVELVEIQGRVESINQQILGFNEKLAGLNQQATDLARKLQKYTDAPWELWDDLNEKRKQIARTSLARWVFLLLDIPTLISCYLTTAVAYVRMFLIAGRYAPRQLARSHK